MKNKKQAGRTRASAFSLSFLLSLLFLYQVAAGGVPATNPVIASLVRKNKRMQDGRMRYKKNLMNATDGAFLPCSNKAERQYAA